MAIPLWTCLISATIEKLLIFFNALFERIFFKNRFKSFLSVHFSGIIKYIHVALQWLLSLSVTLLSSQTGNLYLLNNTSLILPSVIL